MNDQTRELIAIGASVTAHCQPCLTYHVNKAKELGLGQEEIHNALEVGYMVQKGAMSEMKKFSTSLIGQPTPQEKRCCAGGDSQAGDGRCG